MNNSMSSSHDGYLEVILGPMYSGKTSRLVEIYKQCVFCSIPVSVINHSSDNRYDDELLSTHDKVKIPCIKTNKLFDLWIARADVTDERIPRLKDKRQIAMSDVILINEGQFFPDLYDFVFRLLKNGKKIYVCGLDGDFKRQKFGEILDIIPLCDKVYKLNSLCSSCKDLKPGIFSMRLTNESEQMVIGSNNYTPVCRNCYEMKK